jgi:hypothetical protein
MSTRRTFQMTPRSISLSFYPSLTSWALSNWLSGIRICCRRITWERSPYLWKTGSTMGAPLPLTIRTISLGRLLNDILKSVTDYAQLSVVSRFMSAAHTKRSILNLERRLQFFVHTYLVRLLHNCSIVRSVISKSYNKDSKCISEQPNKFGGIFTSYLRASS